MRRRPRTRIGAVLAAGALLFAACGDDDGDDPDDGVDGVDVDDDLVLDEGEDVDDAVDMLAEQYENLGIERAQAECLVDAQRDLQLEPGEPFDPELASELLDQCGIDPDALDIDPPGDDQGSGDDVSD